MAGGKRLSKSSGSHTFDRGIWREILFACVGVLFFFGCVILRTERERPEIVTVIIRESELQAEPEERETAAPGEPVSNLPKDIPLPERCQAALEEACENHGVPITMALGLIEHESRFDPKAVSASGCYGLCQLNPKYFPSGLTPEDNIRHGVAYLAAQLRRYGNWESALTAYNAGHDTGSRGYSNAVQKYAKEWGWDDDVV